MSKEIDIKLKFSALIEVQKINAMLKALKSSLGKLGSDINLIDVKKLNLEFKEIEKSANKVATASDKIDEPLKRSADESKRLADNTKKAKENLDGMKAPKDLGGSKTATNTPKSTPNFSGGLGAAFGVTQVASSVNILSSALSSFITPFAEFDKQLQNIGTLGRKDVKEFGSLLSQLAADIPGSAEDMALGTYNAISAGVSGSAEEITKFVEVAAKAGVAGVSDTSTAVDGLTSVINAYGLETSEAGKVADTFFGAIKLGKTSFSELNSSLASFVPSASAMGVSFDQATGAIARLTAMGTPTSIAGTQMNAVFTLLQKGTAPLNEALTKSGTSLEELRQKLKLPVSEGGGLINVMREIKVAGEQSGKQLAELTGRVEGAKIIESLAGSVDKTKKSLEVYNGVLEEIKGNAAEGAFQVAAESVSAKTDGLLATVQGYFNSFFATIGTGATSMLNTLVQLSPALAGLAGLTTMMPPGTISRIVSATKSMKLFGTTSGGALKSVQGLSAGMTAQVSKMASSLKMLPTLAKSPISSTVSLFNTSFSKVKSVSGVFTSGLGTALQHVKIFSVTSLKTLLPMFFSVGAGGTTAYGAVGTAGVASGTATTAAWAAALAPILAIVGVVVTLGAVFYKLYNTSEGFREIIDGIGSVASAAFGGLMEILSTVGSLIWEVGGFIFDFVIFPFKLLFNLLLKGAGYIFGFNSSALDMSKVFDFIVKGIGVAVDYVKKFIESITGFVKKARGVLDFLSGGFLDDTPDKVGDVNEEQENLNKTGKETIENQEELNDSLDETVNKAKALGDMFKEVKDKAKSEQEEALGSLSELLRQRKEGAISEKEYAEQSSEIRQKGIKATKELNKLAKLEKEAKRQLGIQEKKNSGSKKTQFDLAKKQLKLSTEEIKNEQEKNQLIFDTQRISEGRDKNTLDELKTQELKIEALDKEKKSLEEIFGITTNSDGEITFGMKIKSDEKKEILNQLDQLNTDILKEQNAKKEISNSLLIDKEEIQKGLDDLADKKFEFEIEAGIRNKSEKIDKLDNIVDNIKSSIEPLQKELDELLKSENPNDEEVIFRINELNKEILAKKSELIDGEKALASEKKAIYDKEVADLKDKHSQELSEIEKRINDEKRLDDIILEASVKGAEKKETTDFDKKKSKVEGSTDKKKESINRAKENGSITDEQAEQQLGDLEAESKQKLFDLEQEHLLRMQTIKDIARGEELEKERVQTLNLLEERKKRLEVELKDAKDNGDIARANEIGKELGEIGKQIKEKGDVLTQHTEGIQGSVTASMSNLFTGNEEDVKAPLRKTMSVIAGSLKAKASATVTDMILGQLGLTGSTTGFLALLAIPAIKGIVSSAINAMLNPVLSNLLSFSTGGRADEPTLAIIGDASNSRPGADTEWILRDDQLRWIIDDSVSKLVKSVFKEFDIQQSEQLELIKLTNSIKELTTTFNHFKPIINDNIIEPKEITNIFNLKNSYGKLKTKFINDEIDNLTFSSEISALLKEQNGQIMSYASGSGSIDKPELAVIGDSIGQSERVLNDENLREIIAETQAYNKPILEELRAIKEALGLPVRAFVTEDDIHRGYNKRENKINRRKRGY